LAKLIKNKTYTDGPNGYQDTWVEATAVIEIGADDTPLTLNIPIQLTFEGQGDKRLFFTQGGVTTEITTICSGNTLADNIGLPEGGHCKITVEDHLAAWIKHLTLASLGVKVTTASEATEELIALINDDQTISKGTQKGLTGSLKKVSKILDDGKPENDESSCEKLDGFLDYVNEQDGKKLTEEKADEFRAAGEAIKTSFECP